MRVAIVGAGVTGLTVATGLLEQGHEVEVFEKGQVGGLAGGFPYRGSPGVHLEKFYHHIFTSDREVIELTERYGLKDELKWCTSRSGVIADGKLWRFGSPLDLLRFKPMGSLYQRLLMGWNLRYFTKTDDWPSLDAIRCRDFFARRRNLTAYENFWEPLLKQKFGTAYNDTPASFLWGRIHPRANSRQKGKEALGYLNGGFQQLFLRMAEDLRSRGGKLHTGQAVRALQPGDRPTLVANRAGGQFNRVVWTGSLPQLKRVIANPTAELVHRCEAVRYMAVTQLVVVLKRQQSNYYWLNNIDPDVTFGGLIEHTNMVSPEHYGGEHILYVVNYHEPGDARFCRKRASDVLEHHLPSLKRILARFREDDILRLYCIRDTYASPLYDLGYAERRPPYQGWIPGVDICGMAQVYPEDRNMSHGVRRAMEYLSTCCTERADRCVPPLQAASPGKALGKVA